MGKYTGLLSIVVVLFSLVASAFLLQHVLISKDYPPRVFVGVDIAYGDLVAVENQIGQMRSYINLVIVGSTNITYSSQLDNVCQYICDRGLYFILFTQRAPQLQWLQNATFKWGNHFLGLYAYDELGGKQIDQYEDQVTVTQASNYTDAANRYNRTLSYWLGYIKRNYDSSTRVPLYASDYALYWFNYKAGYSLQFAEFAWNHSRSLHLALVRGAAEVQGKDWGVMITWTYLQPPHLESGSQLLSDMKLAYDNGAKYIVVFDSNDNHTRGTLQPEHLAAMQQFWRYMQANQPQFNQEASRVAFVLPKDYAYGFRGSYDKIWGLWQVDSFALQLNEKISSVLQQYGNRTDIIYDDPAFPNYKGHYEKVIFWNGTITVG